MRRLCFQELRLARASAVPAVVRRLLPAVTTALPLVAAPASIQLWAQQGSSQRWLSQAVLGCRGRGIVRQLHSSRPVVLAAASAAAGGATHSAPWAESASCSGEEGPSHLDWKTGVAMAGASFEAYNLLQEKGLPEKHANGTEVHYLNREFLASQMAGLLQVTIQSARGLPPADPSPFTSDPYLTVCVGDSAYTTRTMLNNLNPEWHESCVLFVRSIERQSISVRVMDYDFGSTPDDYLGSAVHSLAGLCDGQQHELQLELRGSSFAGSGEGGTVHLTCRFLPFAGVLGGGSAEEGLEGKPLLATPGQIPLAEDWQKLLELAGVATHAMLEPVVYVENTTTNTQAWLYWNEREHNACVAFRGTEQGKWKDILTDLHLVPAPLNPDRISAAPRRAALAEISQPPEEPGRLSRILATVEQAKQQVAADRQQQAEEASGEEQAEQHILATALSAVRSTAADLTAVLDRVRAEIEAGEQHPDADQPWVHSGFLTAYDSVRPAVLSLLSAMLEGQQGRWRLYFTGHSLGGALATLCAWDCAHRSWGECQPELVVYTFGSPRVGNRAWADDYNRLVPSTWRIVNSNDLVCTVPRLMGYAHVGHAVQLKVGGEVEVQMHSTEQLGEGLGLGHVAPAVSAAVQATVAAKVPELLPDVATEALKRVGIEVALAGSQGEEAAADEDGSGGSDEEAAAVADQGPAAGGAPTVASEQLADLWQQEREAWSLLLDGSALNEHMEPLYLENLRAYLQAMAEEGQQPPQQPPQQPEQLSSEGCSAEGSGAAGSSSTRKAIRAAASSSKGLGTGGDEQVNSQHSAAS